MIFRVYINFKPGILDPEAEAIKNTIENMGYKSVKEVIKGKFFDIHVDDEKNYFKDIEKISKNLLSNPVIENFKIVEKK
ncbi:phosphoribosylformylglycinamidine synthase, purS protein [bacterium TMED277]|nr:MAG: phosphoribosylformylglycinamidine synthase, purS protein [bacterium TMED277]|tara:strand:- start:583 stop:819 length:237 start_codon:yes stop_codon:yes gene_type:complete